MLQIWRVPETIFNIVCLLSKSKSLWLLWRTQSNMLRISNILRLSVDAYRFFRCIAHHLRNQKLISLEVLNRLNVFAVQRFNSISAQTVCPLYSFSSVRWREKKITPKGRFWFFWRQKNPICCG